MKKQGWEEALDHINRSLIRNWNNHKARHLKVGILRKLGRLEEASPLANESLSLDRFNFGVLFEKIQLEPGHVRAELISLMRGNIHNYIEFALDYAFAGLYNEAIQFIKTGIDEQTGNVYPLAIYFYAWFHHKAGMEEKAMEVLKTAAAVSPDFCFPNQTEALMALNWAVNTNKEDFKAWYYLGNYWYDAKNYDEAISCWEESRKINDRFPTVQRNLALAYFNKKSDGQKALAGLEAAFALDETDARILFELDQLYKRLNQKPKQRLEILEKNLHLIEERDDLYLERVTLYNLQAQFEKAFELLMNRKFHPWEGGEGKVSGQYVFSLTELAKKAIANREYTKALELLEQARVYPENLGEGKLFGKQENDLDYWMGVALEKAGKTEEAVRFWEVASAGMSEPVAAVFYNDWQPDTIFYQGLALLKLRRKEEAETRFKKLVDFGLEHIDDHIKIDYFAVSLPDLLIWDTDLDLRNRIQCKYLAGLGYLGLGEIEKAISFLSGVKKSDKSHQGVHIHLALTKE
jgi:tetratricopeptide (TPR) repeat protein